MFWFSFSVSVLLLGVCFCLETSESETYRLSATEAIPTHYSLKIIPKFEDDTFYGEVSIHVDTKDNLDSITLHSYNLTISEVQINDKLANYTVISDERIKVFYKSETIQPGEHIIFFKYNGLITKNNGFIKAAYETKENKVYLYVTDLEPTYARTVFPCFDEPSFKANFSLKLVSPSDTFKAISNMPEIDHFKRPNDGAVIYHFATSVKMSTYLLSFAFTDPNYTYYEDILEYKDKKIPIKIYTVNASRQNNEFALNCTKKALEFYSEYTNISYPLPKLDMIEYTRNLTAATENWGLITLRQGLLTPSLRIYNGYQVKLVAFHELSHFWFGNLVTNKWWSDLWLQEGFATYMSYKLLAKDAGNRDVVDEMRSFSFNDYFEIEIYSNKSPIVTYLPQQKNIEDVFVQLVYDKGAAVLLMLEDLIGEEKFQQIIREFLKKHQYSSVTTNDFISTAEGIVTNLPVRQLLESYLYQKKYPVISVDLEGDSTYVLTQHPSENVRSSENNGQKWAIPITYQTNNSNISKLWFDKDMESVKLELPNAKWILFNPRGVGIYRTFLSNKLWDRIVENFEEIPFSAMETVFLDMYYSFRFGQINCDIFIKILGILGKNDRLKWIYLHTMMEHIKDNLFCQDHKEEADLFLNYVFKRLKATGHKRKPFFFDSDCGSQHIQKGDKNKNLLSQRAKWVQEILKAGARQVNSAPSCSILILGAFTLYMS